MICLLNLEVMLVELFGKKISVFQILFVIIVIIIIALSILYIKVRYFKTIYSDATTKFTQISQSETLTKLLNKSKNLLSKNVSQINTDNSASIQTEDITETQDINQNTTNTAVISEKEDDIKTILLLYLITDNLRSKINNGGDISMDIFIMKKYNTIIKNTNTLINTITIYNLPTNKELLEGYGSIMKECEYKAYLSQKPTFLDKIKFIIKQNIGIRLTGEQDDYTGVYHAILNQDYATAENLMLRINIDIPLFVKIQNEIHAILLTQEIVSVTQNELINLLII